MEKYNFMNNNGTTKNCDVISDEIFDSIGLEKDIFEIENELLVLQTQQHAFIRNEDDPNEASRSNIPASSVNIAIYSARTSELTNKVVKLYLKLRK